ncbi:MAG: hypothetical protein PsegKO_34730 [Pseudohongiellaceae bacterium]
MKRSELLQGLTLMKFEESYDRTQAKTLTQEEAAVISGCFGSDVPTMVGQVRGGRG